VTPQYGGWSLGDFPFSVCWGLQAHLIAFLVAHGVSQDVVVHCHSAIGHLQMLTEVIVDVV
jgi:hypothetical protein